VRGNDGETAPCCKGDYLMKNEKIYVLAIVLVCISAYGGYLYGGNQRQQAMDQNMQLLNFSSWATEIKMNLQLLDLVEAKKYKDAGDLLERFLDVRLASISQYDKFALDHPDEDIFQAIDSARKHREQHPDHKINPNLEPGVARALKIKERK
jgi:hypothetical protein